MDGCGWDGCDLPGVLALMVAPDPCDVVPYGGERGCACHAVLIAQGWRRMQDGPVWIEQAGATVRLEGT